MEKSFFERNEQSKESKLFKAIKRSPQWLAVGASLLISSCNRDKEVEYKEKPPLMKIELAEAFPVDDATMNSDQRKEFETAIINFLEKHNSEEGAKELDGTYVSLEISSDERQTKKWAGGNEELSEARAAEVKNTYYKFADSLRQTGNFAKLDRFLSKHINTAIAISPTKGRGVTSVEQLANPSTGKQYTPEEIADLSNKDLLKLYDQCRFVRLVINEPHPIDHVKQYTELVKILADFSRTRILLDRSGSMWQENSIFAEEISNALTDSTEFMSHDNKIVSFSEVVDWDKYTAFNKKEDVEKFMNETYSRGGDEHQFLAIEQMLDTLNKEGKDASSEKNVVEQEQTAIVMLSDDGVNDFSLPRLLNIIKKSQEEKVTVFFAMINNQSSEKLITMVDAKGLLTEFKEFVERFDHDEYFPKAGMTPAEKESYIIELMGNYEQYDTEHCGVQIDENGNVRFRFDYQPMTANISSLIRKNQDELAQLHYSLQEAVREKITLNNENFHQKKTLPDDYEKTDKALQDEYQKKITETREQFNKKDDYFRSLLNQLKEK